MIPYDKQLYQGKAVTLDFETTNQHKGNPAYDNHVVCAVWRRSWDKQVMLDRDWET